MLLLVENDVDVKFLAEKMSKSFSAVARSDMQVSGCLDTNDILVDLWCMYCCQILEYLTIHACFVVSRGTSL